MFKKKVEVFWRAAIQEQMALGAQLPVRLEPDVEQRLDDIAKRTGTSKSALIRLLAKTFVDQVVSADGSVNLPPNWSELLPAADGRSDKGFRAKDAPRLQQADQPEDAASSRTKALQMAGVLADRIRAKRKKA